MTDNLSNSLSDNEIKKAYEVFVNTFGKGMIFAKLDVREDDTDEFKHIELSFDNILDLINRLQEKNEFLETEAYKKFAKLLFEKAERRNHKTEEYHYVLADDIVDILKELVGEETSINSIIESKFKY